MSAKELKDKLKKLREEHAGKPISRMTEDELKNEIEHHEVACKTRVLRATRLENLKKARESRGLEKKEEKKEEVEVKVPSIVKAKIEKKKEEIVAKKETIADKKVRKLAE